MLLWAWVYKYLFVILLSFLLGVYPEMEFLGVPGGAVVKNPPANARDTGSSPGPGRSHMPQSNKARAPQLLSLRSRAHEPQLLSPCATTTEPESHNNWSLCT